MFCPMIDMLLFKQFAKISSLRFSASYSSLFYFARLYMPSSLHQPPPPSSFSFSLIRFLSLCRWVFGHCLCFSPFLLRRLTCLCEWICLRNVCLCFHPCLYMYALPFIHIEWHTSANEHMRNETIHVKSIKRKIRSLTDIIQEIDAVIRRYYYKFLVLHFI